MIFAPHHVQANLRAAYPGKPLAPRKQREIPSHGDGRLHACLHFEALRPHASKLRVSPAAIRRFAVKPLRALSSASLSGIQTEIKNETTYFELTTPEHMKGKGR